MKRILFIFVLFTLTNAYADDKGLTFKSDKQLQIKDDLIETALDQVHEYNSGSTIIKSKVEVDWINNTAVVYVLIIDILTENIA